MEALYLEAAPLVTSTATSTGTEQESIQGKEAMANQPNNQSPADTVNGKILGW